MSRRVLLIRKLDILDVIIKHKQTESPELYEDVATVIERELNAQMRRPILDSIRVDIRVQVLSIKQLMAMSGLRVENKSEMDRFRKELGKHTFKVTVPVSCIISGSSSATTDKPSTSGLQRLESVASRKREAPEDKSDEQVVCKVIKQGIIRLFVRLNGF